MMAIVYLGLGSNLGDREANLNEAVRRLSEMPAVSLLRVSKYIRSAPWGVADQPEFLNGVAAIETTHPPERLLAMTQEIERQMGRRPGPRWGPRVIDIDMLVYDGVQRRTPELVLPHPYLLERSFVREPLREIAPDVVEELERDP
jgi:2-amino-4-hydroxy-6-hydroxymethyldihydropteridine diphosphokinase